MLITKPRWTQKGVLIKANNNNNNNNNNNYNNNNNDNDNNSNDGITNSKSHDCITGRRTNGYDEDDSDGKKYKFKRHKQRVIQVVKTVALIQWIRAHRRCLYEQHSRSIADAHFSSSGCYRQMSRVIYRIQSMQKR